MLRALTGAVYVGLIICSIFVGLNVFWLLMTIFSITALWELQSLIAHGRVRNLRTRIFDIVIAITVFGLMFISSIDSGFRQPEGVLSGAILCIIVLILYMPSRIVLAVSDHSEDAFRNTLASVLSMFYTVMPLAFLIMAYALGGREVVLCTFIFIWVNDTGAYLSGINFGRHKLCERLSPKKTWEGFWGGFLLCIVAGAVSAAIVGESFTLWMAYAAVVSVFGTFGDLFESLIKRRVGVKDSGKIIPGHGGILDRIDSLLAVAPLTLLFALFFSSL